MRKTITAAAFVGVGMLSISPPAVAGWGCGWGCGWGAALAGLGVGAIVGGALAPVYVVPPPPNYYYAYGPADYEDYYYGPADTDRPTMGRPGHRFGMALVQIHVPNRNLLRLVRRPRTPVASSVRTRKSRPSSRRLKQKQNGPELTRSPKRTLRA